LFDGVRRKERMKRKALANPIIQQQGNTEQGTRGDGEVRKMEVLMGLEK
jgi:hypothetical protein